MSTSASTSDSSTRVSTSSPPRARHRKPEAATDSSAIVRWYHHVTGLLLGAVVMLLVRGAQNPGDLGSLWIAGLLVGKGDTENLYAIHESDFALITGEAWINPMFQPPRTHSCTPRLLPR